MKLCNELYYVSDLVKKSLKAYEINYFVGMRDFVAVIYCYTSPFNDYREHIRDSV